MFSVFQNKLMPVSLWDRIGLSLSGICAIHCMLTPLAVVLLPIWTTVSHGDAWIHITFAALAFPVTIIAARHSMLNHRNYRTLFLLGTGLFCIVGAAFFHDHIGHTGEIFITLSGCGLLTNGHLQNHRACTDTLVNPEETGHV